SQTVQTKGGNVTVIAGAATAGALVLGGTGHSVLDIVGGGVAVLNAGTTKVTVQLDQASDITLSSKALAAIGSSGDDIIRAHAGNPTLTGGGGHDDLIGNATGGDIFRDSAAGLSGDTIENFGAKNQRIDLTDLSFGGTTSLHYQGNNNGGTLT